MSNQLGQNVALFEVVPDEGTDPGPVPGVTLGKLAVEHCLP